MVELLKVAVAFSHDYSRRRLPKITRVNPRCTSIGRHGKRAPGFYRPAPADEVIHQVGCDIQICHRKIALLQDLLRLKVLNRCATSKGANDIRHLIEGHVGRIAQDAYDLPKIRRSEEHTSELQSLMRISYAVFCLKK